MLSYIVLLCFFQVKADKLDFFPLNRALSLNNLEEEDSGDQIQQLIEKLNKLEKQHLSQVCNTGVTHVTDTGVTNVTDTYNL